MNPKVIIQRDYNDAVEIISPPKPIILNKNISHRKHLFSSREDYYHGLMKDFKAGQERIIADLICGIILMEVKKYSGKFVFFIADQFETWKIFGRLAYLGLPIDRITILFVSTDIKSLLRRNMVSPFDRDKFDLSILLEKESAVLGPYPNDDTITLSRTFYRTYNHELYPVKIDLFSQFLDDASIREIGTLIKEDYFHYNNTEHTAMLDKRFYTRLPKLLVSANNQANFEKSKDDEME
jgi:hypothetical protein